MYLTSARFRTLGLGVDLTDVTDLQIRAAIGRATATIDSYCNVPNLPQKHSFRGGVITLEEHAWFMDAYERPHPFQYWPWHTPILSVEFFAIFATNDISVEISPDNIFINNSGGYLELSSLQLTQFGIFGAGIVPLIGLFNPVARSSYTYGHRFVVVDELADPIDTTYKVYQAANQFWTVDTVVVKKNGTPVVPDSIDRVEGRFTFTAAQTVNDVFTVSYTYVLPLELSSACGLLVARDIDESQLRAKGLGSLASIRVQEVELRRAMPRSNATETRRLVPDEVQVLLDGYVFGTAR